MSIGMTFVMVSGGIDLSTYTIVSAASVVGATAMVSGGYSPLVGCFLMVLVGARFWLDQWRGHCVRKDDSLHRDFVHDGRRPRIRDLVHPGSKHLRIAELLRRRHFRKGFRRVPIPAIIIIAVAVIAGVILDRTQYGRWLYLTGTNEAAARISGIPVRLTIFLAYVFSGLMAGITAIVLTAMVGTATTAMVRDERLMDVIATTVIGGASLKGGSGSVLGTMFGLLFITVLGNSFNLLGVSPFVAIVIKGAVLVMVIGLDVLRSR